jgi:hypothetical protein
MLGLLWLQFYGPAKIESRAPWYTMQATVTLVKGDPEFAEEGSFARNWEISFEIKSPGGLLFRFGVSEPYLCSLSAWRRIANGTGEVNLYQGNGEGSISSNTAEMCFTARPSGAGGDVTAEFTVPRALVADGLAAVLDEAERLGFLKR